MSKDARSQRLHKAEQRHVSQGTDEPPGQRHGYVSDVPCEQLPAHQPPQLVAARH